MGNVKKKFEELYYKYWKILSLKELDYFAKQLEKEGYIINIKRNKNLVKIKYEKANFKNYLKRALSLFKNNTLKLMDWQKYIYKV